MADEPKAPEPAPAPAPPPAPGPAPAKAEAAPGGGGSGKMIGIAVGAVVAILVLVFLVKAVFGGSPYSVPGVSAKLDTPENCAKSYAEFKAQQAWSLYEVHMGRAGDDMSFAKSLTDFYEDKAEYEKTLQLQDKMVKLYKDKKSEMKKYSTPEVKKTDDVAGNKAITISIKRKYIIPKREKVKKKVGDQEVEVEEHTDWEIKEDSVEMTVLCTQIGKEWRIMKVQGENAVLGMWGGGRRGQDD